MSATPSANRIVCKLEFNGDIRRFHLESPSFSEVVRIAARRFSLSESDLLRVVFADPDGDLITINDDSSLQEAISCSGQVLRLSLVPSATPLPLSPRAEKKPSASVARDTERIEAKIAALRETRIMLARRGTCVGRWAQRAREGEANERIDKVRQKLASRVAEVQARADKLSAKFPEFAARFQHAASEPTQAELREFVEKLAPRITCDGCQAQITLSDTRFNCEDCFDFDLCATCEAKAEHDPSHVLRKMLPEAQQVQPIFMNRHCRRFAARHGAPHHSFSRHGDAPSPFGPFVAVPLAHPSGDAPFPPFAAGPHHHHHHRGHHRGPFAAAGAPHHHQRGPFGGPHHQHGPFGAPHPHRGGPFRGFGGGFGAHCAEKQEKTKRTPQASRAAIEALLKEKIVPQLAAFPLLGSIPLMDIAAEILDLLEAQAPKLLKRVHCVLARLAAGSPLNTQAIAHRLEKSGLLTPELVAALQEVLHRHLGDLDISLDGELFQSVVASFCNAQRSNRRSPPGFSRCPRFNNAPAPAPAAEPVAPEAEVPAAPQPDLSASVALAAMSVPADVIEQLLAQTNGNLELAATLWEAMQE